MKKKIVLLLALVAAFNLVACGSDNGQKKVQTEVADEAVQEVNEEATDDDNTSEAEEINSEAVESNEETEQGNSKYSYLATASVGDVIEFGNYNGYSTWKVLDKTDTKLIVISEFVVDEKIFNDDATVEIDWETCTLRTWMNGEYYNQTFSDEEKALICDTQVDGTTDKVYLLSNDEVEKYISDENDRVGTSKDGQQVDWMLRAPIDHDSTFYYVPFVGYTSFYYVGEGRVDYIYGVRPVINIDISNIAKF